jgi:hypothetical protein
MDTVPHPCVDIHTTATPQPSIPPWFAETVLIASYLRGQGLLGTFTAQIHLVRGRFGRYEALDFLAVLFGYAISGEQTLQTFFDRLHPFAEPFMARFERETLPHRSTLSRFLAAVDSSCLDALRTTFATSSFVWGWTRETIGGLWDRAGQRYLVFAIDATREAARQRKLPTSAELPRAQRRLDALCGPGYLGHRRGEVVRTRTTVLQMHTRQWLGSFGGRGNGDYRGELHVALQAVNTYLTAWEFPSGCGIVRVDGQYGDSAVIADIIASGMQIVVRKRGYRWLHHPLVQAALAHDPVARITTRESQVTSAVFDVPQMLWEDGTTLVRLLLTRRPWKRGEPIAVGKVLGEWVYEQFVTTLPPDRLLATDVLDLYQGRGAFEGTLADEDREGDPDRWCSLTAGRQAAKSSGRSSGKGSGISAWPSPRDALSPACARWSGLPHSHRRVLRRSWRSRFLVKSQCMDRWSGRACAQGDWALRPLHCKARGRCAAHKGLSCGCRRFGKRRRLRNDWCTWPALRPVPPVPNAPPAWGGPRAAHAADG